MIFSNKKINSKLPYFSKEAWRYFYHFFKGSEKKLVFTSLGFVFQSMLIIPILLIIRYLFDVAIPQKQIQTFFLIGLTILGIRLFNVFFTLYIRNIYIKTITESIRKLRVDLLEKVFGFARSYYTREDMPLLHTRIIQDTERISGMINVLISGLFPSVLILAGLSAVLIYLNGFLFLIIIFFIPVLFFFNRYMGRKIKTRVFSFQRAFEAFSKGILYVMNFMDIIKIQSTEKQEKEKHEQIINNLKTESKDMIYIFTVNAQFQTFLVGIIGIMVMVGGGISVSWGTMTIGDLIAFYMASNHLQSQLNTISNAYTKIVSGNESLLKLFEIAQNEETIPYSGSKEINFTGNLALQSVSFKYTKKPVLSNLNLSIIPGNHYAIIGSNGAGKSTIINLILGFYKPQSGIITAENELFENIDLQKLRKHIGVVTQHPPLIPGTISENIFYGNPNATDNQIIEVSRLSLADDFIRHLPDKYDTQIGDSGVLLSGGERQKIAIARALLRTPGLLILDEPTNHLDNNAVKEIMGNIKMLSHNPAILIISHDMSVVNHADEIFVIKNGGLHPHNISLTM